MQVFVESYNITSPLGFTTKNNIDRILKGESGIRMCNDNTISPNEFPASAINNDEIAEQFSQLGLAANYTRFEKLAILSINKALSESKVKADNKRTLFILSTTKGNVELLNENIAHSFESSRLNLDSTAQIIAETFNFQNIPVVVSNACISGLAAILMGKRLINQGFYDNVVVNGTDVLSKFIASGFQSFLALSEQACKPFDANRTGLTLGEASATIILSKKLGNIEVLSGAISNDANHISGPSRTGEGLYIAINKTIERHGNIDLISAHGTATPYNDDMESIAISRTNLNEVPVNSLKGYYGHTLGAAGIIESIVNIESLKRNMLIATLGCDNPGTVEKINVALKSEPKELKSMLKLASGFGGCNAATLFLKHE